MTTEYDRRQFRVSLALARDVGHAPALDAWRAAEILPGPHVQGAHEIDAFVARAAITHHHPVGTCALGRVVDAELRPHGLRGVHIVDASVIPSIPSGPVNAAVVAIAEIWAAHIGCRNRVYTGVEA